MDILDESKKFEYQTCMGMAIPGELPRIKGSYNVGGRIYNLAKLEVVRSWVFLIRDPS